MICESFQPEACAEKCDFVFLAGEAGLAMRAAPVLLEAGVKVVDLSADFRLEDPDVYAQWYKVKHTAPHLLDEAVYGLPELNKIAIETARLVANPGCHVTAAVLALAPLLSAGMIAPETIIIDSLSGRVRRGPVEVRLGLPLRRDQRKLEAIWGGRRPPAHPGNRAGPELCRRGTGYGHVHSPSGPRDARHSVRSMRSTASTEETEDDLRSAFHDFYADAPFVRLFEAGQFPATKPVFGTNYCHVGLALDPRTSRVVVVSRD